MGTAPGSVNLLKAGFVVLDGATGAIAKTLVFQYNPATLVRRLTAAGGAAASVGISGSGGLAAARSLGAAASPGATAIGIGGPIAVVSPPELVSFTLALDASDKLNAGDPVTQQDGLLPMIAALELLLYQPTSLTVWVSGSHRVIPVNIVEMVITEQAFDRLLNPIRAEVAVELRVLKDADLPANSKGRALWDAHYVTLLQLSNLLAGGKLSTLGITGI